MTPPNFFFGDMLKIKNYTRNLSNIDDLKLAITNVINETPFDMCENVSFLKVSYFLSSPENMK